MVCLLALADPLAPAGPHTQVGLLALGGQQELACPLALVGPLGRVDPLAGQRKLGGPLVGLLALVYPHTLACPLAGQCKLAYPLACQRIQFSQLELELQHALASVH